MIWWVFFSKILLRKWVNKSRQKVEKFFTKIYLVDNICQKEKFWKKMFMQILCFKLRSWGYFANEKYFFSRCSFGISQFFFSYNGRCLDWGLYNIISWSWRRKRALCFCCTIIKAVVIGSYFSIILECWIAFNCKYGLVEIEKMFCNFY